MIIVIDGYNLVKYIRPHGSISDKERRVFVHTLARYGKKKRHKIIIVFDGGLSEWPYKEKIAGVTVLYSGRRASADDVIMQYLEDHHKKDMLLVSSDHELNLFASHHTIVSIGVEEFTLLLKEADKEIGQKEQEVAISFDEAETDFDMIMEQATQKVPYKEDDKPHKQEISFTRTAKKDKVLLKKLKKL